MPICARTSLPNWIILNGGGGGKRKKKKEEVKFRSSRVIVTGSCSYQEGEKRKGKTGPPGGHCPLRKRDCFLEEGEGEEKEEGPERTLIPAGKTYSPREKGGRGGVSRCLLPKKGGGVGSSPCQSSETGFPTAPGKAKKKPLGRPSPSTLPAPQKKSAPPPLRSQKKKEKREGNGWSPPLLH